MLMKVEYEVTYDIWEVRCYWLAYKMMTNKFTREEETDNKS